MALRTPAFNDAKSYGFEWLRALLEAALQEGVIGAGDLKVTAAAAGGQRVDIAAGSALVKGDSGVPATGLSQGLFLVVNDAAVANAVTLNASDATNPRVDQIVLRVRDSADLGSGADDAVFEVVTGVPTAGATLDNRTGAAALPADRVRLADVLVPAASAAVTAGNVRDRRPWARGAYYRSFTTPGLVNTTTSTFVAAGPTARIECSGAPVRVKFRAGVFHSVAGAEGLLAVLMDAVPINSAAAAYWQHFLNDAVSISLKIDEEASVVPAAGSHLFSGAFANGPTAGTASLNGGNGVELEVEELVRQVGDNT